MKPLMIDLFCGSFGWSAGWLELGGRVVGFDLEHEPHHGPVPRGADLVLQDVRTIDGAQFAGASLIVASSPCQEFSYRAMPWKRAKALGPPLLGMELFAQAERIQREAIAAAGHFIPMVQENVRGAQKWVGRARWHYGSYYLWGDVPALMPITLKAVKQGRELLQKDGHNVILPQVANREGSKNSGGSWFNVAHNTESGKGQNPDGRKLEGSGPIWFDQGIAAHGSKSSARKAASARIAKIPLPLASHIARVYYPSPDARRAP